eukprot:61013_1
MKVHCLWHRKRCNIDSNLPNDNVSRSTEKQFSSSMDSEELDCITSIYADDNDFNIVCNAETIEIHCSVKFTNQRNAITVRFVNYIIDEDKSLEISVENWEQSSINYKLLSNDILHRIESTLIDLHGKETENMPIFQCISYVYTELIDETDLLFIAKPKPKSKEKEHKPWWLTPGTRIEYKYKRKTWKNGSIFRITTSNRVTRITIKYWKTLCAPKALEWTEKSLLKQIEDKMLRPSNIEYPLWIHTHSPVWILAKASWKAAKIIHYVDGKHIMIQYNHGIQDDDDKIVRFDPKSGDTIRVFPNCVSILSTDNESCTVEPFSIYWNQYTSKYLTNAYSTNVIYNTYYKMLYDVLDEIPLPICTLIIDYLGFDALNLSPPRSIKSAYKVWNKWDKAHDIWIGVQFSVKREITNVFGVEMDVNITSFGQVFGLLCSSYLGSSTSRYSRSRRCKRKYEVRMLETEQWENSDYLRLFFFECREINEDDDDSDVDEMDSIEQPMQICLKPNRTYRLAFAVKSDLPIFYWREGTGYRIGNGNEQTLDENIQSMAWGGFAMDPKVEQSHLFEHYNICTSWSPNFRLLIA